MERVRRHVRRESFSLLLLLSVRSGKSWGNGARGAREGVVSLAGPYGDEEHWVLEHYENVVCHTLNELEGHTPCTTLTSTRMPAPWAAPPPGDEHPQPSQEG